jgi:hypothetical protein
MGGQYHGLAALNRRIGENTFGPTYFCTRQDVPFPIHSVASRGPSLLILALSITDIEAKIPIWSSICLFIHHNCLVMLLPARVFKAEKYLIFTASILHNKAI